MEKKWKIGPFWWRVQYCSTTFLIQEKIQNSNSVYFAWVYFSRIYLISVLWVGGWALNPFIITMKK